MPRVLHVLAQRPGLTGSGVTLDALVRQAARRGWRQRTVVAVPATETAPAVGELPAEAIAPLRFETGELDFPVPGMSDVMPYRSSVWSRLDAAQLRRYRRAWTDHLARQIEDFRPNVVHSHHVWLVSSLLPSLAADVPVVVHCHATGLRQMRQCPELAEEVRRGCRGAARFATLHDADAQRLVEALGIERERISVVGAGYREELFHSRGRRPARPPRVAFAGKLAAAKGLPWLLDAVERLLADSRVPGAFELHVAGSGSGEEALALEERMRALAPAVVMHGQLDQRSLADLLRSAELFVLPSLYEGLPLVLVEAAACGCRLVATDLAGVRELAPALGERLRRVPLPAMRDVDRPVEAELPAFVAALADALEAGLAGAGDQAPSSLASLTWAAVFERVERVWREVVGEGRAPLLD